MLKAKKLELSKSCEYVSLSESSNRNAHQEGSDIQRMTLEGLPGYDKNKMEEWGIFERRQKFTANLHSSMAYKRVVNRDGC